MNIRKTGFLNNNDIRNVMIAQGVKDFTLDQADKMIQQVDKNGDKQID